MAASCWTLVGVFSSLHSSRHLQPQRWLLGCWTLVGCPVSPGRPARYRSYVEIDCARRLAGRPGRCSVHSIRLHCTTRTVGVVCTVQCKRAVEHALVATVLRSVRVLRRSGHDRCPAGVLQRRRHDAMQVGKFCLR